MTTPTVADCLKAVLDNPSSIDYGLYQTHFPVAFPLALRSVDKLLAITTPADATAFDTMYTNSFQHIFMLINNQIDSNVSIGQHLDAIATATGLTKTFNTPSELDVLFESEYSTLTSSFEKYIVAAFTLAGCAFYMKLATLANTNTTIEDIDGGDFLPSYFNNTFRINGVTVEDIRNAFVMIGITSFQGNNGLSKKVIFCELEKFAKTPDFTALTQVTGVGACSAVTTCAADVVADTCNLGGMYGSNLDPFVFTTRMILTGLYYYAWVGLKIFKI